MSMRRLTTRHVKTTSIKTSKVFPTPQIMFNAHSIDFDGDTKFGSLDLRTLSKKQFTEYSTMGDGHCFFRVLHRFMKHAKLYTSEEQARFKRVRDNLNCDVGIFPEITYLRRIAQKFCLKIDIKKYGRYQSPSEDAMSYAVLSQAIGLECARRMERVGPKGYADSPDYEACATTLQIIICILQVNGKWQIFPYNCLQEGFGEKPIMFAYNSGAIHFNSLVPNMRAFVQRKYYIESIASKMILCKPTTRQVCHMVTCFNTIFVPALDRDCFFVMNMFKTTLDTAIEMVRVRRLDPEYITLEKYIETEKKLMAALPEEMIIKLLTYEGFKTAKDLMFYLTEKRTYLNQRDNKIYTKDEVVQLYLNGD